MLGGAHGHLPVCLLNVSNCNANSFSAGDKWLAETFRLEDPRRVATGLASTVARQEALQALGYGRAAVSKNLFGPAPFKCTGASDAAVSLPIGNHLSTSRLALINWNLKVASHQRA